MPVAPAAPWAGVAGSRDAPLAVAKDPSGPTRSEARDGVEGEADWTAGCPDDDESLPVSREPAAAPAALKGAAIETAVGDSLGALSPPTCASSARTFQETRHAMAKSNTSKRSIERLLARRLGSLFLLCPCFILVPPPSNSMRRSIWPYRSPREEFAQPTDPKMAVLLKAPPYRLRNILTAQSRCVRLCQSNGKRCGRDPVRKRKCRLFPPN